jgi:hypothetical protein
MTYDAKNDPQHLPGVYINPGTGPVEGSNEVDAFNNMVKLCEDAGVIDKLDMPDAIKRTPEADDGDGRLEFTITLGDRTCEVSMPGIPLLLVRFLGEPGQSIWDFPRLYVNGSSWVWKYAIGMVHESLLGEEEGDG